MITLYRIVRTLLRTSPTVARTHKTITELAGDPTVQSPCADVAGVASTGILQVLTDSSSLMAQCLQAILPAELTDNAGWELLIKLADNLGHQEMVENFETALAREEVHLQNVRT